MMPLQRLPSPGTRLAPPAVAPVTATTASRRRARLAVSAAAPEKMEKEEKQRKKKTIAFEEKNNVVTAPSASTSTSTSTSSSSSSSSSSIPLSSEAKRTVEFLRSLGTSDVVHTGGESFLSHLVGVYRLLRSWDAPEYLCLAGLAHSIYSTEGFQDFSLECTRENRARVAGVLGSLEAERIAHAFCCTDRASQDEGVFLELEMRKKEGREGKGKEQQQQRGRQHRWRVRPGAPLAAAPQAAGGPASPSSPPSPPPSFVAGGGGDEDESSSPYPDGFVVASREQWLDFTTLTLADWMEQVESAARRPSEFFGWREGQAWGYRRTAFAAMAEVVGGAGKRTHAEVMSREPEGSKGYEWRGWQDKREV